MLKSILAVLPPSLSQAVSDHLSEAEELRLRIGQVPAIIKKNRTFLLKSCGKPVSNDDFEYILASASGSSVYAVNDTLRQGYLTLPGGHRIGFCGEVVTEKGTVKTFRRISSAAFRIAKEKIGIGVPLDENCLIIGPPGAGKTTLLRDCVRILSDEYGQKICLIDERGEVAAVLDGCPQFSVGRNTDVLTGCKKAEGLDMLTRTMSPQWIALDEITQEDDVVSICRASYCGVKLLATAHAWTMEDLQKRPIYRQLMEYAVFELILILQRDHSFQLERLVPK